MIPINVDSLKERIAFAERADAYFREHKRCHVYTDDEINPGTLLAIKWAHQTLVVKVDRADAPTLYEGIG